MLSLFIHFFLFRRLYRRCHEWLRCIYINTLKFMNILHQIGFEKRITQWEVLETLIIQKKERYHSTKVWEVTRQPYLKSKMSFFFVNNIFCSILLSKKKKFCSILLFENNPYLLKKLRHVLWNGGNIFLHVSSFS